jgi:hypothetical protein
MWMCVGSIEVVAVDRRCKFWVKWLWNLPVVIIESVAAMNWERGFDPGVFGRFDVAALAQPQACNLCVCFFEAREVIDPA